MTDSKFPTQPTDDQEYGLESEAERVQAWQAFRQAAEDIGLDPDDVERRIASDLGIPLEMLAVRTES